MTNLPEPRSYRGLYLDRIETEDYELLYEAFVGLEETARRWNFRGSTPSPDDFVHSLWRNVYAHFIVRRVSDDTPIGYVSAYAANMRDQYCYIAGAALDSKRGWGSLLMGMGLLIDTIFETAPFRKVYAEATEVNAAQYRRALGNIFTVEGTYRSHEWHAGAFQDTYILGLFREEWEVVRTRYGFA